MTTTNNPPSSSGASVGSGTQPADDLAIPDFLQRCNNRSEVKIETASGEWLDKWAAASTPGKSEKSSALKHSQADGREETGTPIDPPEQGFEIGTEPTRQEVLKTIERLSKKQADIERLKTKLKEEFISRVRLL